MAAIVSEIKKVAKAIASGAASAISTIVLTLDVQPTDHQGIQYITQAQWGIIALAVLASYGITWRVPNSTELPGEPTAPSSDPTPLAVDPGPARKGA